MVRAHKVQVHLYRRRLASMMAFIKTNHLRLKMTSEFSQQDDPVLRIKQQGTRESQLRRLLFSLLTYWVTRTTKTYKLWQICNLRPHEKSRGPNSPISRGNRTEEMCSCRLRLAAVTIYPKSTWRSRSMLASPTRTWYLEEVGMEWMQCTRASTSQEQELNIIPGMLVPMLSRHY